MSYDLMVFDPTVAPPGREDFLAWYRNQTQWAESHGYDNPAVSAPALRAWFTAIIKKFPPMNGPLAADDEYEPEARVTDYSVGRQVIYAAFAWSQEFTARKTVIRLAREHGVGFFDVSADNGGVWLPSNGGFELAHGQGEL